MVNELSKDQGYPECSVKGTKIQAVQKKYGGEATGVTIGETVKYLNKEGFRSLGLILQPNAGEVTK